MDGTHPHKDSCTLSMRLPARQGSFFITNGPAYPVSQLAHIGLISFATCCCTHLIVPRGLSALLFHMFSTLSTLRIFFNS